MEKTKPENIESLKFYAAMCLLVLSFVCISAFYDYNDTRVSNTNSKLMSLDYRNPTLIAAQPVCVHIPELDGTTYYACKNGNSNIYTVYFTDKLRGYEVCY